MGCPGRIVGYARVGHPDATTLHIEFPRRMLGKGVTSFRWAGSSVYYDPDDPESGKPVGDVVTPCPDNFPDAGSIRHSLR